MSAADNTATRVVPMADALSAASEWRAGGQRLALAEGIFDVFGARHSRLLAAARLDADRLVVAVVDDAEARKRLGPGRPIVPAEERARLVAAIRGVDRVVVCDAARVESLPAVLQPFRHMRELDDPIGAERIQRIRESAT